MVSDSVPQLEQLKLQRSDRAPVTEKVWAEERPEKRIFFECKLLTSIVVPVYYGV